jgi:ADP-ribose pyrophosphatase YjhB (NUDIX family)
LKITSRSYTEEGYQPIPQVRLSDEEYGRALQRFIPVCADIVVIDRTKQTISLAARTTKPGAGLWWIGGGITAGTSKEAGATANFKRETGLELPLERFELVAANDYKFKDRAQEPSNIGCHMFGYIFVVELTTEEQAAMTLDPGEYAVGQGLRPYNREELVQANVRQPVLDLYDDLFPS